MVSYGPVCDRLETGPDVTAEAAMRGLVGLIKDKVTP